MHAFLGFHMDQSIIIIVVVVQLNCTICTMVYMMYEVYKSTVGHCFYALTFKHIYCYQSWKITATQHACKFHTKEARKNNFFIKTKGSAVLIMSIRLITSTCHNFDDSAEASVRRRHLKVDLASCKSMGGLFVLAWTSLFLKLCKCFKVIKWCKSLCISVQLQMMEETMIASVFLLKRKFEHECVKMAENKLSLLWTYCKATQTDRRMRQMPWDCKYYQIIRLSAAVRWLFIIYLKCIEY